MKQREWKSDAWFLCHKHYYPGSVPVVIKGMEHGYQLGLKDATEEFRKAIDAEADRKRLINQQR
jgi:hypothetical protein